MNKRTCTVPECAKEVRSARADYCGMHYHRLYRHGSIDADYRKLSTGTPRLYRMVRAVGHPTAGKNGNAYKHRKALYDAIGGGTHACHWCGCTVEWFQRKGAPNNLVVDHLNGDKGDNTPSNLAPSCNRCNSGRATQEKHRIITEQYGAWSVNDTIDQLRNANQRRRSPIVSA